MMRNTRQLSFDSKSAAIWISCALLHVKREDVKRDKTREDGGEADSSHVARLHVLPLRSTFHSLPWLPMTPAVEELVRDAMEVTGAPQPPLL